MPPSSSNAPASQLPTIANILNAGSTAPVAATALGPVQPRISVYCTSMAAASTAPRELTVDEIIQSATREELQNYIDALIVADKKNSRRIEEYHRQKTLLQERQRQRAEAGQMNNAANAGHSANSGRKRKAETQIAVCITCLKSYDEADNHDTACVTHPGPWEADMDHDMWGDIWEEDFQGRDHNHEDFFNDVPEAFIMECCGNSGDSEGCKVDRHFSRFQPDHNQSSNEAFPGQSEAEAGPQSSQASVDPAPTSSVVAPTVEA